MKRFICIIAVLAILTACVNEPEKTAKQEYVLGTVCSVSAYDADEQVLEDVFSAVRDIEARMSVDGEKSEIHSVNEFSGIHPVAVSSDTLDVIKTALKFSSLAPGSFDISIGPLVQLWGIGKKEHPTVPSQTEIKDSISLIDYSLVQIDGNEVFLPKKGMSIDLGGIAKGYSADIARNILAESGVNSALLDFGGNILTMGTKPDGTPWRIGIQDPSRQRGSYIGILRLVNQSAVTSGPYERYFNENGKRYHHILDPVTGYPAESGIESVTIITDKSIRADALSTTVFILGLEKGMDVIKAIEDTEAVIIYENKNVYTSSDLGDSFVLTDETYSLIIYQG